MTANHSQFVQIERRNGMVLISFCVEAIDELNFDKIADDFEAVIRIPTPQTVVIDLTGIRRIDDVGLAVLQSLRDSIREVGGTARLIGPLDKIEKVRPQLRQARDVTIGSTHVRPQWIH